MRRPDRYLSVEVLGGALAVARWGDGPRTVVAAHGITASSWSWTMLAEQLDEDWSLLAPDLRGRGRSADVGEPFGLARHADDLAVVLDHVGADDAVLVGHSMGGFVAAVAGVAHPERFRGLVLADGGLTFGVEPSAEAAIDEVLEAVIGPALDRLRRTWPSLEAYRGFWREHPGVAADGWTPQLEAYVDADAVEVDGAWRSRVRIDPVRADAADTLIDPVTLSAVERLTLPTRLLWAPRGLLDEAPGLYREDVLAELERRNPHVTTRRVDDVNHYTLTLSERGAAAIAEAVAELA